MKIEFEKVYFVYESLFQSFHKEEQFENDEEVDLDPVFLSLWTLYLNSVQWTEEEFWEEMDKQSQNQDCSCDHHDDDHDFSKINELDTSTFTGYKKPGKETLN